MWCCVLPCLPLLLVSFQCTAWRFLFCTKGGIQEVPLLKRPRYLIRTYLIFRLGKGNHRDHIQVFIGIYMVAYHLVIANILVLNGLLAAYKHSIKVLLQRQTLWKSIQWLIIYVKHLLYHGHSRFLQIGPHGSFMIIFLRFRSVLELGGSLTSFTCCWAELFTPGFPEIIPSNQVSICLIRRYSSSSPQSSSSRDL